jgi:hypothetical protein
MKAGADDECRIPHTLMRVGVKITTNCQVAPLRLIVEAGQLIAGDVLFSNLDETKHCIVSHIKSEETPQEYFGLNW